MAEKEEKPKKSKKKKSAKKVEKISVSRFCESNRISSKVSFFLNKKYGDRNRKLSDWKKICKDENISL